MALLLTWTISQSGIIRFNPQYVSLKELVAESLMLLENIAHQKQISTQYDIDDNLLVYANKEMLRTVVRNLISNALKYTDKGGLIKVYTRLVDNSFFVYVHDNGVGMPEEVKSGLFKPGENVSVSGTRNEKGTEPGLILCKEFVDRHGGNIGVASKVGKGATFWFSIPDNFHNKH